MAWIGKPDWLGIFVRNLQIVIDPTTKLQAKYGSVQFSLLISQKTAVDKLFRIDFL